MTIRLGLKDPSGTNTLAYSSEVCEGEKTLHGTDTRTTYCTYFSIELLLEFNGSTSLE
jgi:hypothetical protein